MNQKEYELIAGVLRDKLDDLNALYIATNNEVVAIRYFLAKDITNEMANKLEVTYDNFNRDKFLKACGVGE